MKKTPIKKLDLAFIIEYYCEKCDISIIFYPEITEINKESSKIF